MEYSSKSITVIGAGLAGCEAAWQVAKLGARVTLVEMKPRKMTPAHRSPLMAELVCSNSLRSADVTNAVGLLKEEMRRLGSLIIEAADNTAVPAGFKLLLSTARRFPLTLQIKSDLILPLRLLSAKLKGHLRA